MIVVTEKVWLFSGQGDNIEIAARLGHLSLGLGDPGKAPEESDMTSTMLDSTVDVAYTGSGFRSNCNPVFVSVAKLMRKVKP
jgi:hypothetical protein